MEQKRLLIIAWVLLLVTGCSNTIDYLVVGTGTPEGNEIYVTNIEFDNEWSAIGGIMSCCWEWATGTQGVYNRTPPTSVYVSGMITNLKLYMKPLFSLAMSYMI